MTPTADLPLDNTPEQPALPPTIGPNILVIAVLAFFALVLWLAVAFQILFMVPRFNKVFADFRLRLPWVTELVIRDAWWLAPAFLLAAVLICIPQGSRWAGLVLLILLPLAINLLILAGLYFPYAALVEGLGGNAPKF